MEMEGRTPLEMNQIGQNLLGFIAIDVNPSWSPLVLSSRGLPNAGVSAVMNV